ncbi:chemotaxis protein CheB [Pontibacter sp. Tf4]|uniref:chemotaxis protein CheB n=1 Tax=Pontibacter sp. Tf4 TaxID=2761620 RepID=UPI001626A7E2|nr:chemotaxis protein CheB [Pontibacter sp. Tf4]MBB6610427.1 chemotaxis protein CheB [Pontibacter sp. Tf4]
MSVSGTRIRVLLADQSSRARLVLGNILEEEPDLQVAGGAVDADALVKLVKQQRPDVVLLNYSLPGNKNLFALQRIFHEAPVPVVLLLKREQLTADLIQHAMRLGVYAFVSDTDHKRYPNYRNIAAKVIDKVRTARLVTIADMELQLAKVLQEAETIVTEEPKPEPLVDSVIVIGASTGGQQAVEFLVKELSAELSATILLAVHLPAGFSKSFVQRLQRQTGLTVKEGRTGLLLRPNNVIVAPGGRNMVVHPVLGNNANYKVGFAGDEIQSDEQPSVDLLMQSVANSTIKQVIGVILTGMGKDGTKGAAAIYRRGGTIVAQDKASSTIFGMARSVIDSGVSHHVLPLSEIPQFLNSFVANSITAGATGDTL